MERKHLYSLRLAYALREVFSEGYGRRQLTCDIMAGLTVGVVAIPLAMALAIASGVAPQYGLYTAIIAGAIIALAGGSRFSVSGPTAAFVVILQPLAASHGLSGLLIATIMAGLILLAMAYARLGRFIEYIPQTVTLGFTAGIAVVIALLQLPDFIGAQIDTMPQGFAEKLSLLASAVLHVDPASFAIASLTMLTLILWPRLGIRIPPHLPALLIASLMALLLGQFDIAVDTIGSRFHFAMPDGATGSGIPPYLPFLQWPWLREGGQGISLSLLAELLPTAFAIAMLAAIESLLCAVILDGMSSRRHSANSELLALGMANIITPLFGGITATAAIARSATNYKAGAVSPIAALTHALVVLSGLVLLAKAMAYVPMSALAALLLVTAWNMSEAGKSLRLLKSSPLSDVWVWLICMGLTVLFDMVIAITTGLLLACVLLVKELATLTQVVDISGNKTFIKTPIPANWKVLKINGPLFFAAGERIGTELAGYLAGSEGIILMMRYSPYLDAGGLSAIEQLITRCKQSGVELRFTDWQFQPLKTLARSKNESSNPLHLSYSTLDDGLLSIQSGEAL